MVRFKFLKTYLLYMKKEVILLFILLLISLVNAQYIFHVDVEVTPKIISAGENIIVNANIKSLGLSSDRIDVKISYGIQDENGKIIEISSSTNALQTSLSISEVFKLSDNIKSGKYNVIVKVDYQGYNSSASDSFYVKKRGIWRGAIGLLNENPIIPIIIFFLIFIIFVWWMIHHHYTHHKKF